MGKKNQSSGNKRKLADVEDVIEVEEIEKVVGEDDSVESENESANDMSEIDNGSGSEEEDDEEGSENSEGEEGSEEFSDEDDYSDEIEESDTEKAKPRLTQADLDKYRQKVEKTGVVYMSRVPPRLKADKLRRMLAKFKIPIGKIYLAPEDPRNAKKRKLSGGSRRKLFTEGWIEFMNKNKAKALVKMINNTSMDPRKRSFHHEDMWNLKYLPKFKWNHLTERIAYEKEARAHRLRNEVAHAKKINSDYMAKVEKSKMIESMEAKKRHKEGISEENKPIKVLRHFNQRPAHTSDLSVKNITKSKKGSVTQSNPKLDSVLDKIFG